MTQRAARRQPHQGQREQYVVLGAIVVLAVSVVIVLVGLYLAAYRPPRQHVLMAGNQRYKCRDCGSTKVLRLDPKYGAERQTLVTQTYLERNSSRSTARIFGISHRTVLNWLKKSPVIAAPQDDRASRAADRPARSR